MELPSVALERQIGPQKKLRHGGSHVDESCPHFPHTQLGGHQRCQPLSYKWGIDVLLQTWADQASRAGIGDTHDQSNEAQVPKRGQHLTSPRHGRSQMRGLEPWNEDLGRVQKGCILSIIDGMREAVLT